MPVVTFKIFDGSYSLDIGQSDWTAAKRTDAKDWSGQGRLMGADGKRHLQGIRTHLNQSRLLEAGQFREWGATKPPNCPKERRPLPFLKMLLEPSRILRLGINFGLFDVTPCRLTVSGTWGVLSSSVVAVCYPQFIMRGCRVGHWKGHWMEAEGLGSVWEAWWLEARSCSLIIPSCLSW